MSGTPDEPFTARPVHPEPAVDGATVPVTVVASAAPAGEHAVPEPDWAPPAHLPDGLVAALLSAGHDARLVLVPPPSGSLYADVAERAAGLAELLPNGGVVHALDPRASAVALAARRLVGGAVVTRWGALPATDDPAVRATRTAVLRAADAVVCPGEQPARTARSRGAAVVSVVPDGVDTATLVAGSAPAAPLEGAGLRLVSLSGPDADGGTATLVAALRSVPGARLVVAGRGSAGVRRRLTGWLERAGVADRVEVRGLVPRAEALALLDAADVLVAPRAGATSAAAALEAMCRARVVVGADVPVLAEVMADRSTGLLVPPRDPAALSKALQSLQENPFRREAWGLAGQDRVVAVHDWRVVLPRLQGVYRAVAAERRPAPVAGSQGQCSTGGRWSSSRHRSSPARPRRHVT